MENKITNTDQQNTRLKLIEYQKNKGVKWIHIAKKIDVPHYVLSNFKDGKKNLWDVSLSKLQSFLESEES